MNEQLEELLTKCEQIDMNSLDHYTQMYLLGYERAVIDVLRMMDNQKTIEEIFNALEDRINELNR